MPKRTLRTAGPEESWRPVPGYEHLYEVSDQGQVRRLAPSPGATVGYILKPGRNGSGYVRVTICPQPGKRIHLAVHRLVLTVFVGSAPAGHQCNHKDGNKANNRVSNLEWATPPENVQHAIRNGLRRTVRGEQHGNHKLTQQQVDAIRVLRGKEIARVAAARFGVSKAAVTAIWAGRTWRIQEEGSSA